MKNEFGADIRTLIDVLDMSQREFAEAIGVPLRTLENWIAGKNVPSPFVREAALTAGRKLLDKNNRK